MLWIWRISCPLLSMYANALKKSNYLFCKGQNRDMAKCPLPPVFFFQTLLRLGYLKKSCNRKLFKKMIWRKTSVIVLVWAKGNSLLTTLSSYASSLEVVFQPQWYFNHLEKKDYFFPWTDDLNRTGYWKEKDRAQYIYIYIYIEREREINERERERLLGIVISSNLSNIFIANL